jgi:malate/lactate dehydrogenase
MSRPVFRLLMSAPNKIQNNQIASEILLVDPKIEIRDAQVQDLSDATYHGNTSTRVRAAEHKEAGQCDVIVVTAGAAQKEGKIHSHFKHLMILFYLEMHTDIL